MSGGWLRARSSPFAAVNSRRRANPLGIRTLSSDRADHSWSSIISTTGDRCSEVGDTLTLGASGASPLDRAGTLVGLPSHREGPPGSVQLLRQATCPDYQRQGPQITL